MNKCDNYHTKQKDIIFDEISNYSQIFTIRDIYEKVKDRVGLTTVYRLVDKLVNEGILYKMITKDNTIYYQYIEKCCEKNHFYLKCDSCGLIIHIDCDCITDLSNHISKRHKFLLNQDNIIIGGKCIECLDKENLK